MVETSFNLFDTVVLGMIALSALLSFFRGFIREILSLGAWVGASLVTLYTFVDVAQLIEPQVGNPTVASGLAALGVFIFALMGISIFNALLMKLFKKGKDVGMLDNMLGLGFGVLRACLLVSLGYFIFSFFLPEKDYPEWLATAQTRPYVEQGADMIAAVAPNYLENLTARPDDEEAPVDVDAEAAAPEDHWMRIDALERMIESRQNESE